MTWVNVLHIYQPPTQKPAMVKKITQESYLPILKLLEDFPDFRITINIGGCLVDWWQRLGYNHLFSRWRQLAKKGQVEFLSSAKYHPIIPLIPQWMAKEQIRLNDTTNRRAFGSIYAPKGFFFPELAVDDKSLSLINNLGYRYTVVPQVAVSRKLTDRLSKNHLNYPMDLPDLVVLVRHRRASGYLKRGRLDSYNDFKNGVLAAAQSGYLITAIDGEIIGHHRQDLPKIIREALSRKLITTATAGEFIHTIPVRKPTKIFPASWASLPDEQKQGNPYAQWQTPGHCIHQWQWRLARLALAAVKSLPSGNRARQLALEGLHSCHFWYGSCRPWWDAMRVEQGIWQLKEAVCRSPRANIKMKKRAEELYQRTLKTILDWERNGRNERLIQSYNRWLKERVPDNILD